MGFRNIVYEVSVAKLVVDEGPPAAYPMPDKVFYY